MFKYKLQDNGFQVRELLGMVDEEFEEPKSPIRIWFREEFEEQELRHKKEMAIMDRELAAKNYKIAEMEYKLAGKNYEIAEKKYILTVKNAEDAERNEANYLNRKSQNHSL